VLAEAIVISEKSPEAFRTISEVSSLLDVPQHVLRFWESRFAQIRPLKRAGGRRYYRPEDVDLLRGIRTLLYSEGFTIKGVQKILRDRGLRHVGEIGRGAGPGVRVPVASYPRAVPVHHGEDDTAPDPSVRLAESERVRLEILLAELLKLKARLYAAMGRSARLA
jgi:DNA-binding transcriptional MerR regulator